MLQEYGKSGYGDILMANPERVLQLKQDFMSVSTSQIAALIDYDGTISPLCMNSWDIPALSDLCWNKHIGSVREMYGRKEITEKEYWQSSIDILNNHGFTDYVNFLENACLPIRTGVPRLFQNCSNLGRFIVYSAGIGEVIEKHVCKVAEIFETAKPIVVANRLDNNSLIYSSNKDGNTLKKELVQQGQDLYGITHYFLIGDSVSDVKMSEGLDAQSVLKIGLLSQQKASDPRIREEYLNTFDIVVLDDFSVDGVNDQIEPIVNRY